MACTDCGAFVFAYRVAAERYEAAIAAFETALSSRSERFSIQRAREEAESAQIECHMAKEALRVHKGCELHEPIAFAGLSEQN